MASTVIGPQTVSAPLSADEKSRGLGLDPLHPSDRRTVRRLMALLTERLAREPSLSGLTFTRDYPTDPSLAPRAVWQLEGRRPGIEGRNAKSPYLVSQTPCEDGTVIEKRVKPNQFEVSWQILAATSDEADAWGERLEEFLEMNPHVPAVCGAEWFQFAAESAHGQFDAGGGQPLKTVTLHFSGVLNRVYLSQTPALAEILFWPVGQGVTLQTIPVTRDPSAPADLFPLPGPLVLVALHGAPTAVAWDFVPGVDYEVVWDQSRTGRKFFLSWLTAGRAPAPGTLYYATFCQPWQDGRRPRLVKDPPGRPGGGTAAVAPRLLGQEIDPRDPQRGRTILWLDSEQGILTPGLSPTLVEALLRADAEVVSQVDPDACGLPAYDPV